VSSPATFLGQHYAFAHGRLGVLRQSLLTQSDVNRLLGARDAREAGQILTELKLTAGIDQSLRTADAILAALAGWIRSEVEDMVKESKRGAFDILWIADELPLLAYLLKKRAGLTSAISVEPTLSVGGRTDALRALVLEDATDGLSEELVAFVQSVTAMKDISPETIDALVAGYGARERLRLARASDSSLVVRYVKHSIDAQNLRTALRLLNEKEEDPLRFLLDGGTIPREKFAVSFEGIRTAVASSDLHFHLLKALTSDIERPTALETGLSDLLAKDMEDMWQVALGLEAPFAFAATALSQLRLLRAIMLGKRNELSPQDIKQILPPFVGSSRFSS